MKCLIVDDHAVVREGIAAVLQRADAEMVTVQAETGAQALALATEHGDLDVVFLDLMLPPPGGLAVLEEFGWQHPGLPVIMLSSSEQPGDVRRSLARGALGYVPKSATSATLLAALHLVRAGEIYVPPFVLAETLPRAQAIDELVRTDLTERQIAVLLLMAESKTNKEIAYQLGVSEKTVKAHITAIFRALRVASRGEAVRAAKAAALI